MNEWTRRSSVVGDVRLVVSFAFGRFEIVESDAETFERAAHLFGVGDVLAVAARVELGAVIAHGEQDFVHRGGFVDVFHGFRLANDLLEENVDVSGDGGIALHGVDDVSAHALFLTANHLAEGGGLRRANGFRVRWTRARGWGVLAERAIDESTHGGALMRDIQQISRETADDGAEDAPAGDKGDGLRDEEESTSTSVQKVLDVLPA